MKRLHANSGEGASPYTCAAALRQGGPTTRLSALVMGFGNMANGQILKGLLFLAVEVAYIFFMIRTGIYNLSMLVTLGSVEQEEVWDEAQQVFLYTKGDQSILLLLYGVATILLTVLLIWAWRGSLRSAYKAECLKKEGSHLNSFREDLASLLNENLYRLLMTPPMFFIAALTILPLIFMICMAFTNYSKIDNHLVLFDWVGLENFAALFDSNSILGSTFWSVLIWTLVWAVFATFTNYIFGMILALLINRKETRAKGFWRFCFVLSSAVPMFVSLLIMRTMLQPNGAALGFQIAKGFFDTTPYAVDEAALIDGCTRWQIVTKITLPLSKPIIVYTLLTAFIGPWVDFIFAKVICRANSDQYTVAIGLWKMLEKEYIDSWYTSFAAGAVLISIPIALIFLKLQKYYVDGMSGAVKG